VPQLACESTSWLLAPPPPPPPRQSQYIDLSFFLEQVNHQTVDIANMGMFSKLPWSSQGEQNQQHEEEQSLTSVLPTPDARSDLTCLVANCTETMRKGITDTFDPNETGKMEDIMSKLKVEGKTQQQTAGADDSANTVALPENSPTETQQDKTQAEEQANREQAAREKELSEPKMQELQKAALTHFDDWREAVLLRIGEVVNQREEAMSQKKEAHAQTQQTASKRAPEPTKYDEGVSKALKDMCPPSETPLAKLDEQHRALILHSVLLLLLSLEHYSAYSRVLLLHLTSSLNLSISFLADDESKIARGLLSAVEMKAEDETRKKQDENQGSRKWKVGLASVAGAAIIGVTGGLAAPLVAAGIGSVMGGLGKLGIFLFAGPHSDRTIQVLEPLQQQATWVHLPAALSSLAASSGRTVVV
jgi:hypothetical protein